MSPSLDGTPRSGFPERIVRILDFLNAIAGKASFTALWVLTGVVLLDITLRAFGTPTLWGAEVSVYLMLALAFLGVGHATTEDAHFRVTILTERMRPQARRAAELLCDALALAFTIGFTIGSFQVLFFYNLMNFHTNTILRVPLALLQALVAAGGVFLALALFANLLRGIFGLARQEVDHDLPPA